MANPEKHRKRVRKWQTSPQGKAKSAAYFQQHKERLMEQRRARKDLAAGRFYTARHRCRQLGIPFDLELDEWKAVTDGVGCIYCGNSKATEIDKIVPALGYVNGNVAPACRNCNRQKSDMTLDDFRRFVRVLEAMEGDE